MAFTKLTSDVEIIQKMADRPQMSAADLKKAFDTAVTDIKKYLVQTLVPEMEKTTAAGNLGADAIGDGDPNQEKNIQAKLKYLYDEVRSAQMGQIPARSITAEKIVEATLTANELAEGAVQTDNLADAAVTAAKLNGGLLSLCPIGMGMVWWSDTLPSEQWMFAGGTLTPGIHDEAIAFFGGNTLPDVKGRVIVGKDDTMAQFNELYRTGGSATHTLVNNELPQITGSISAYAGEAGLIRQASGCFSADTAKSAPVNVESYAPVTSYNIANFSIGGGQAHNNLQPYIVANYIFKVL